MTSHALMLAALFVNPVIIPLNHCLWYMIPLCVAVAIVYKAVRVKHLSDLPREAVVLLAYMAFGLTALGVGLWVTWELLH